MVNDKRVAMIPIPYYVFEPKKRPAAIIIFVVICNVIIIFKQQSLGSTDYFMLILPALLLIFAILYLQRRRMIIDNYGIINRQIFKETFIEWSEIKAVDIESGSHGNGLSLSWKLERFNKPVYSIDFSFSRNNMHILAGAFVLKCTTASISDKVKRFAKDKNTSLLFNR